MDTQTGYGDLRASDPVTARWRLSVAEARAAVVTIVVLAAVGGGLGLLWSAVSPRVHVIVTATGPDLVHYGGSEFFGGEGSFVIIGAVAGILATLVAWSLGRRWRGPVQLVALTLGCLACAAVAWQVGSHIGLSHFHDLLKNAGQGRRFTKPVDLRGRVALVAQPFTAVVTYLVLVSWVARPDLGASNSVEPHGDLQLGEGDRHGPQPTEHGHLPLQQP